MIKEETMKMGLPQQVDSEKKDATFLLHSFFTSSKSKQGWTFT